MKNAARSALIASVLTAVLPTNSVMAEEAPDVGRGKALVEANCARCHGIGHADRSPHAQAPEFRTLSQRYPIKALEEALAVGIATGHLDMPEFLATPEQAADIIAFIETLQP